jgi:hypothetical protein
MTFSRMLALAMLMAATAACSRTAADLDAQDGPAPPAAPTLRPPSSPSLAPDANGFIQRWLILEPIRRAGPLADSAVRAAVNTEYFPDQFTVLPRDGDRVTVNDTAHVWHAVDTSRYNVNLFHFAYALGKPTSNVLFWVVTVVDAPRNIPNVRLAICSNAASVWWLNGQEVIGIFNDRQAVIDDGVSKRVTLREGPNIIRGAVINGGGATDFCARFIDEQGNPVRDFMVSIGVRQASR